LCFSKEGERGASLKINIGELLSVVAVHDEAGVVEFFNHPWWWKAASGGHVASRSAISEPTVQVPFMQLQTLVSRYFWKPRRKQLCEP